MNSNLYTNISEVVRRMESGEVKFEILSLFGIYDKYLMSKPLFIESSDNSLTSKGQRNFGFYILPNSIRGIIKSINFHVAGYQNLNSKLLAPSVLNYYTAAFHNLEAYLALNGIIYFYPINVYKNENVKTDYRPIVLRYSPKKNNWYIENGKLNHKTRWLELKRIYNNQENTPKFLLELFDYFYNITQPKEKHLYDENIDEFFGLISNTRHLSAYNSYGSDPNVVDMLRNGDLFNDDSINLQAKYYHKLSKGLIEINLQILTKLINELNLDPEVKKSVFMASMLDNFDEPMIESIEDKELNSDLKILYEWFGNFKTLDLKTRYA